MPDQTRLFQWTWQTTVFVFAATMLLLYLVLWWLGIGTSPSGLAPQQWPLLLAILGGGGPLVWELTQGLLQGKFGSDLLAAISIVTSLILGEYVAGTIVVMMLSGGEALESYAVRNASSVLNALAKRMPRVASVWRTTN